MAEFGLGDRVRVKDGNEWDEGVIVGSSGVGGFLQYEVDFGTEHAPCIETMYLSDLEKTDETPEVPTFELGDLVKMRDEGDKRSGYVTKITTESGEYPRYEVDFGTWDEPDIWRTCLAFELEKIEENKPGPGNLATEEDLDRLQNHLTRGSEKEPSHYTYLRELIGVEPWDILDCVAGDDPHMWNLGKYWFRLGRKDGESTLKDKKKMLTYLQRSIEKEEGE